MRRILAAVVLAATVLHPAPAAAADSPTHSVAYVGASITSIAVSGYGKLAGPPDALWTVYQTGSGQVCRWVTEPQYWAAFDVQAAAMPPIQKVWWQLAQHDYEGLDPAYLRGCADQVLAALRTRTSAPVYVSAMADYDPALGALCPSVVNAPAAMQALADDLVADGLALPGPAMTTLTSATVKSDGCHQNNAGAKEHGRNLKTIFGT